MAGTVLQSAPMRPADLPSLLRELHGDTPLLVVPALGVASAALYVLAGTCPEPLEAIVPCIAVFLLGVVVWGLRRCGYLVSAWTLVVGCIATDLLVASTWGSAVCLLAIPVGLAALLVGTSAGALVAVGCTVLLGLGLGPPASLASELRIVAAIAAWGTVGLVWLTSRPLLTALQWSWSSYERSLQLLEQARDQRVQLKRVLEDLAHANTQLMRLNHLAQNLRRAAEEARKAKEQFVANVSHELRTPLNMVIGFAETILQAPHTYGHIPPALLADLAVILRNSQHLSSLIDDVLDLSQSEAGQLALARERTTIGEIIDAAATAVRPLFVSKKLYLEAEVPQNLPLVFCDRVRIREVVLNLLSNAGRFTEQGGVTIKAWQEGADIAVSVTDSGPGIAAAERERLFRPFEQLDDSIRQRYGGTGLGLAISRKLVELHGGRMWLESEVGKGTTFFFRLPIDPPAPLEGSEPRRWLRSEWEYKQPVRASRLPRTPPRPRLVVLEPGHSLQRLLARYLDQVEIAGVASLEEALAELARVPAQALLVNDTSTGEALARLQVAGGLPYGTPAVICSVPGTHEAADALGVAEYLLKPVARETLLAVLERLQLDGKTVLVVDDEPEVARLFRRMLNSSEKGYRVLTASEGREGLAVLRAEHPDAVLLDLIMPVMDGCQFLAEKGQDPDIRDIPVVVISASDPTGQPVATGALTITRGGGLAMSHLLACLEAVSGAALSAAPSAGPAPPASSSG